METAVVYFSRNGSTRIIAELLSTKLSAKLVELTPVKPLRNFILAGFASVKQKDIPLSGDPWKEISKADQVILASPVWAGRKNPVMNSFISKGEFKNKEVHLVTVQADPHKDSTERVLPLLKEMIIARDGSVTSLTAIHGASPGKTAERAYLEQQLASWPLP